MIRDFVLLIYMMHFKPSRITLLIILMTEYTYNLHKVNLLIHHSSSHPAANVI